MCTDPTVPQTAASQPTSIASPDNLATAEGRRAVLAGLGLLTAGALIARRAEGGPLSPPAGPISSTPKPLAELEPRIPISSATTPGNATAIFRITQPGSYYLTGNLTASVINRHVIAVAASNVTIDLNGFTVRGLGTSQGAFDCIFAEATFDRICVRNGYVELAGRRGISLETATYCAVDGITVKSCPAGIVVGTRSSISNCNASANTGTGFNIGEYCSLFNCIATGNGGTGFSLDKGSTLLNCVSNDNSTGYFVGSTSTLQNCVASLNRARGFSSSSRSIFIGCIAESNQSTGFYVGTGCSVSQCGSANNTGFGFQFETNCKFSDCSAHSNTVDGFSAEIALGAGCLITNCSASSNGEDGIAVTGDSVVLNCHCRGNGTPDTGSGIRTSGGDNRIEGNTCVENRIGILCSVAGNLIIRNTCANSTTTNYSITTSNRYGPIINLTATGTASANGNSAPSTVSTSDPHANFAY